MQLATYITNVQDLLNDPNTAFYTTAALTRWINRARVQVAKKAQCIRLLTPASASITSFTQVAGGSGYTTPPTVTISGPDMVGSQNFTQATGTAVLAANAVASITVTQAGTGYVKAPTVTLSGGGGTGASFTANLGAHLTTTAGQELYTFSALTTALANAAVAGVIDIMSVAVAFSGVKPILDQWDFSSLQAYSRSYATGQSWPAIWARYAQGEGGSFYVSPVPSDTYAMEVDCICTPADLSGGQTVDLIPDNWTEPVIYYAAYLAYLNASRMDSAKTMLAEHGRLMGEARADAGSMVIPSMYPTGN